MAKLRYKILLDNNSAIPGLIIHTAEAVSMEEFLEFQKIAEELLPKTSSLSFDEEEPFVIFERHSMCLNLIEHCEAIYTILHKIQYGEIPTFS